MTVGENIRYLRKNANLSQEELAAKLLVSRQTISLWESGQTLPTIDNFIRLKQIFGISVDEMLGEEIPIPVSGEESAEALPPEAVRKNNAKNIRNHIYHVMLIFTLLGLVACSAMLWLPAFDFAIYPITGFVSLIICFWCSAAMSRLGAITAEGRHPIIKNLICTIIPLLPLIGIPLMTWLFIRSGSLGPIDAVITSALIMLPPPAVLLFFSLITREKNAFGKAAMSTSLTSLILLIVIIGGLTISLTLPLNVKDRVEGYIEEEIPSPSTVITVGDDGRYSGDAFIYYTSDMYFDVNEADIIEDILTGRGAKSTESISEGIKALCPDGTLLEGADYLLILVTSGEEVNEEPVYGKYMILSYLANEGILRVSELGCFS